MEDQNLHIVPRNIQFEFDPDLPVNWHSDNPAISHFYDALSLTFPQGERFFIDSVRLFADQITDPDLQRDIKGFYAQEATHSREHTSYNALLSQRGIPVEAFSRLTEASIKWSQRVLPAKVLLASTCAYEHYTALFAESILGDPRVMAGAHPLYRDLWRWHAMEEEEHKAVAFNVYQAVAPGFWGYLRRVITMLIVTFEFMLTIPALQIWLMAKSGELFNGRAWGKALWHLWGTPGIWRHVVLGIFPYLLPGFHPDKRRVDPKVLEWRAHYRTTKKREMGMHPTLFGES
jgi:predicted metal-dependent hydrolase